MGKRDFFLVITAIAIGFVLSGLVLVINRPMNKTQIMISTPQAKLIKVFISGEINKPGVYALQKNSRVYELIDLAGGIKPDVSIDEINLASILYDGQHVHISNNNEEISNLTNSAIEKDVANLNKININKADINDLILLPGIGESKAEAIIQFRDENGPFEKIEDILNVPGIGDYTFNQIKNLIVTNQINE